MADDLVPTGFSAHLGEGGKKLHPPEKSSTWWSRGLGLAFLLSACLVAFWVGEKTKNENFHQTNGGLEIDPKYLDFGTAWEDSKFKWQLPLQNSGSKAIKVLGFSTSCSCLGIEPQSFILGSGETRILNLVLNLMARSPGENSFKASIRPHTRREPLVGTEWILHGRVRRLLNLLPDSINFADLLRGRRWLPRTVAIATAIPLDDLKVKGETTRFEFEVSRQGPRNFQLHVTPKPGTSLGAFRSKVFLFPKASGVDSLAEKALTIEGVVREEVESCPSAVLFGVMRVGDAGEDTVALKSLCEKRFEVIGWKTFTQDLSVRVLKVATNTNPLFQLHQKIRRPGSQRTGVLFEVCTADGRVIKVPVAVSYYGLIDNP